MLERKADFSFAPKILKAGSVTDLSPNLTYIKRLSKGMVPVFLLSSSCYSSDPHQNTFFPHVTPPGFRFITVLARRLSLNLLTVGVVP